MFAQRFDFSPRGRLWRGLMQRNTVNIAPPNPADLAAIYWWDAGVDLNQSGSIVTWTDRISGTPLTNNTAANGVVFGSPAKIVNVDHDYRPALLSRLGALHGAVTPMAQNRLLSVFIVARAGNDQYHRMFAAVNADLVHTTGRWSVAARDHALYAANRYSTFNNAPAQTNDQTFIYEWTMGPNRTLGDLIVSLEGEIQTFKASTDTAKMLYSDFGEVVLGATPAGTATLNLCTAEIEHVIVMDAVDATTRAAVMAWWNDQKTKPDTKAQPRASVVMQYGQSNTVGAETNAATVYARHGNRCFAKSLETWTADVDGSGGTDRTKSQALKERTFESGMARGLDALVDYKLLASGTTDWRDIDLHYFAIHPGVSGRSIEQLTTSTDYNRVPLDLAGAKAQAGAGATFDWLWWVQGFSNATDARGAYGPKLMMLIDQIKADAVTAGFNAADPNILIGQHCTSRTNAAAPNVSLDQLDVADTRAKTHIVPMYQLPWLNGTHLSTIGQQLKGEYFAKAMLDIEAGTYEPVRLALKNWTATEITLTVSGGNGVYALDTTNIAAAPNMGFDVWGADDATLIDIISGVTLAQSEVTISLASPAPIGAKLGYGWGRSGMAQPANAPYALGNIRDADVRSAVIGGVTYPLYNWMLIQEVLA